MIKLKTYKTQYNKHTFRPLGLKTTIHQYPPTEQRSHDIHTGAPTASFLGEMSDRSDDTYNSDQGR